MYVVLRLPLVYVFTTSTSTKVAIDIVVDRTGGDGGEVRGNWNLKLYDVICCFHVLCSGKFSMRAHLLAKHLRYVLGK